MYGYALARYARLRGEARPAWAAHLDTNPRITSEEEPSIAARGVNAVTDLGDRYTLFLAADMNRCSSPCVSRA
jgi:hypothetical protein